MPSVTFVIRLGWQTTHSGDVPPLDGTSTGGRPKASSATAATARTSSQLARIRKARGAQSIAAPARGGVERCAVRCFAGDRAQLAQLLGKPVLP